MTRYDICSWIFGILLTASIFGQVGAEGEEYAPQWEKYVPFGSKCSITEVPSETCGINLNFFTETKELDCNNIDIAASAKCRFLQGNFQPDPCYGLTFANGMIWKEDIRASFAFCSWKTCSPVIESGIIYISSINSSGSATTPITNQSAIRKTNHSNVRETSTDIDTTISSPTAESLALEYGLIAFAIVFVILLLTLVYCRRRVMPFFKRCKSYRDDQRPIISSLGQSHNAGHGFQNSMSQDDPIQLRNLTAVKFSQLREGNSPQKTTLSRKEVQRIGKELKQIYNVRYKDIKTCSPLDPNEWMELDLIYTNLSLLLNNKQTCKQPLKFDELLGILTSLKQTERILLLGEAGVGKTSLLSKIAFDWAKGRCLKHIDLLFLISLREVDQSRYFGDYLTDEFDLEGSRIDEYIRSNQRKVVILFDGLDEHKGKLDVNSHDAIIRILTVNKFVDTPIVVTTRPWRAEQITSSIELNRHYKLVEVEGFNKDNVTDYILKFFDEDKDAARCLIDLIENDSVVAENMAPFPIFCNMLCYIWRKESKRQTIQLMKTFSQLIYELVYFLQEHSFARKGEGTSFHDYRRKCNDSFIKVGEVAFYGLLERKLVFEGDAFASCQDAVTTACHVGVLTKEKRFAPKVIRQKQNIIHLEDIRFPHKLLQEYLAGFYLESLHQAKPEEFCRLVKEKLLLHYREFRYLFYFTAAQAKAVGTTLMKSLFNNVEDQDFIIDTAFECHNQDAIANVVNHLKWKSSLTIQGLNMPAHTTSAYVFFMEACNQYIKKLTHKNAHMGPTASREYATAILSIRSLQSLELHKMELADEFFSTMAQLSSKCQIKELSHRHSNVGPTASPQYATGIFSMPALQSLELIFMELTDGFFSTMAEVSSKSQLQKLTHWGTRLGPTASHDYATGIFSLPSLQSLELDKMSLANEFFTAMVQLSSQSQIKELNHLYASLGPQASREYATSILSIPSLQTLQLHDIELANGFFSTLAELSSQSQVTKLSLSELSVSDPYEFAKGIFSMSCLQSLTLDDVGDFFSITDRCPKLDEVFFSTMAELSSNSKLTELCHKNGNVDQTSSHEYARGVCSMPILQSLTLENMTLDDGFFSSMASTSSQSQIKELRIDRFAINQPILHILLSLPRLQSLTLCHIERRNSISEISREMPPVVTNSIESLGVDAASIKLLCEWGLHKSCPLIKTITLMVDSSDGIVPDIPEEFRNVPNLIELNVRKDDNCESRLKLSSSFSQSVKSSCPNINRLSMADVEMGNETAPNTILEMMAHGQMTHLDLLRCGTDDYLDNVITEINKGGTVTVSAIHGEPKL